MTKSASAFDGDIRDQVVGRRLSSVTFVMDYVRLGLDPPPTATSINALTPITVSSPGGSAASGDKEFRNLLCDQLLKTVDAISLLPGNSLTLIFGDGSTVAISLREEHYPGPEAINISGGGHFFLVI